MGQFRALHGLEPKHLGVHPCVGVSERLGPAVVLIKCYAVIGDNSPAFSLHGYVLSPFQFGKCFTQRNATDVQFLRELSLLRQWMAVGQKSTFNAVDEFIDHPLFFVKSSLFYHAQSNSPAMTVRQ